MCDLDTLGQPIAAEDREFRSSLANQCDVVLISSVRGSRSGSLGHHDTRYSPIVTSGWQALATCESADLVPLVHLVQPLDRHEPTTSMTDTRKGELLDRPLSVLVVDPNDAKWLRSRGRFPKLLVKGPSSEQARGPICCVTTAEIGAGLCQRPSPLNASITFGEALEIAGGNLISDSSALLDSCLDRGGPKRIQTLNLQHLYLARRSPVFRRAIGSADGVTADGWPVVQLMRSMGLRADRATGADLVGQLLSDGRAKGLRIAILGGDIAPADKFAELAEQACASVVFREHGNKTDWDPSILAGLLTDAAADLTLIAVTQPVGDLLAVELHENGYRGTTIGIGASIELLVGGERRAAPWIQSLRLEWLYRLVQDPKRLWKRYFIEGIPTYLAVVWPRTSIGRNLVSVDRTSD